MSVTKEKIDNIVDAYFRQPTRSLTSIIFNEYAKDFTLEESEKVYEMIKDRIDGEDD